MKEVPWFDTNTVIQASYLDSDVGVKGSLYR